MKKFKARWDITQNWQLIFPFIGIIGLAYCAYKLAGLVANTTYAIIILSAIVFYLLLKITLWTFKKLKHKWVLKHRWEMIRVFIVFAITGSTSAYIGKPIFNLLGITKESLNPFFYWVFFIIIGLVFYQILLVSFGWLFGQFNFFWEFEKKMLKRLGFKRFFK